MNNPSSYLEIRPPKDLAESVVCFWRQELGVGGRFQWIVPDGCVDILVFRGLPPRIAGPDRRPRRVRLPAGTSVAGVRLAPGVARAVLGLPLHEIADRQPGLRQVLGPEAGDEERRASQETSLEGRWHCLKGLLRRRLKRSPDGRPRHAVRWLARHPDREVEELARDLGLGNRRLLRLFRDELGYGPKTLQRILRVHRAMILHGAGRIGSLAALAAESGFADQAHMSREFSALAGASPGARLPGPASPLVLSDLFKTG